MESKKDEKVEEVEQKQEEIPKIEKEAQQTNNEIPLSFNMENLNQTSIFIGVGGLIAVLCKLIFFFTFLLINSTFILLLLWRVL